MSEKITIIWHVSDGYANHNCPHTLRFNREEWEDMTERSLALADQIPRANQSIYRATKGREMSTKKQWVVVTYAGEWAPEVVYGPFESVSEAAEKTPKRYTATILPTVDGVRSRVEDNGASALFRRLRQPTVQQILDRATQ